MAWREILANRKKLVIFMSAIILGVAAQVAITSFRDTLNYTIDNQARELLGADLVFEKEDPFSSSDSLLVDSLSKRTASEIRFASMVYHEKGNQTRLSQIRAREGPFPFYGELTTEPSGGFDNFVDNNHAVVDESLLLQFNISVGDSIKVGGNAYKVTGILKQVPGEAAIVSVFGPRVYLPRDRIAPSLLQRGSRVEYRSYLQLKDEIVLEQANKDVEAYAEQNELGYDTVEERKEDFGEAVANMAKFLNLIGFIALLLGGIGVASSIHVYIKNKISTIAILHCVGASRRQTLLIYLLQAIILGLGGAVAGIMLGLIIQLGFPALFSEFLPVEVDFYFSFFAISVGLIVGVVVSVTFALMPLLSVTKISPLNTLRSSQTDLAAMLPAATRYAIYGLILVLTGFYAFVLTQNYQVALYFTLGIAAAFLILSGISTLLITYTRNLSIESWPYVWRQGIANLYRPNNQTTSLVLSLGLGVLLIFSMIFSQQMLLGELNLDRQADRANLVFFDIQSDQIEPLTQLLEEKNAPVLQKTPIVTMNMSAYKGRSVNEIQNDTSSDIRSWPLRHEYRATYRDSLSDTEELIEGEFIGEYGQGLEGTIPITVAQNIYEDLRAEVGDTLAFNVQGMTISTYISGVRKVDWQRVQPNFLVVFPKGVLEPAPKIYLAVTRTQTADKMADLQSAVVSDFPNVSAINLQLILDTVQTFLGKISFAIQFMALFSIITGIIVLLSSVALSRFQRLKENVLLKTLGAMKQQIIKITGVEYLLVGFLASLTGFIISIGAAWLLGYFYFDIVFIPTWWTTAVVILTFTALIVTVGMFASRDLFKKPPLEILRLEGV